MSNGVRWLYPGDHQRLALLELATYGDFRTSQHFWTQPTNAGLAIPDLTDLAQVDGGLKAALTYSINATVCEIVITSLTVHPKHHRKGNGRALIYNLLDRVDGLQGWGCMALVTERNLPAQLLLKACGFKAIKLLKGQGTNGDDAFLFAYSLTGIHESRELAKRRVHSQN